MSRYAPPDFVYWALAFMAGAGVYSLVSEEPAKPAPEPSLTEMCDAALVEFSGLESCAKHPLCQMSNQELADHYRSRKEMLVYCAADNVVRMLVEAQAMDGRPAPRGEKREGT